MKTFGSIWFLGLFIVFAPSENETHNEDSLTENETYYYSKDHAQNVISLTDNSATKQAAFSNHSENETQLFTEEELDNTTYTGLIDSNYDAPTQVDISNLKGHGIAVVSNIGAIPNNNTGFVGVSDLNKAIEDLKEIELLKPVENTFHDLVTTIFLIIIKCVVFIISLYGLSHIIQLMLTGGIDKKEVSNQEQEKEKEHETDYQKLENKVEVEKVFKPIIDNSIVQSHHLRNVRDQEKRKQRLITKELKKKKAFKIILI
jgi:hypothetical protein